MGYFAGALLELQEWSQGSPITINTLSAFMIAKSDNTATEALMDILGDQALQEFSGSNGIVLSPNQAFKLKFSEDANLVQSYAESSKDQQEEMLVDLDTASLPDRVTWNNPIAIDTVEWFYSTRELCQMMEQVQGHPVMTINSGVANPENWNHVAFKGGSEPGVLNLTTWLESEKSSFCVSLTQNDTASALDEDAATSLYSGILNILN